MSEQLTATAPPKRIIKRMSSEEWAAEGFALFGTNEMDWRWVCPACGHVASTADYRAAGADILATGFVCIGVYLPRRRNFNGEGPGPCSYMGGGVNNINPVTVVSEHHENTFFNFGDPLPPTEPAA